MKMFNWMKRKEPSQQEQQVQHLKREVVKSRTGPRCGIFNARGNMLSAHDVMLLQLQGMHKDCLVQRWD